MGRRAALLFLLISVPLFALSYGERSPYILTTASFPAGPWRGAFGAFGYNYIVGRQPLMAENPYYLDQTLLMSGSAAHLLMYFTSIRPLYAFVASAVAAITGVTAALMLVNYAAWALAAYAAWRLALDWSGDDRAALVAVLFVSAGLGFVIHVHDYSPHLISFTTYYVCVVALYESRVWKEARPIATHTRIGLMLALASLAYSIGIVLVAVYVLVALRTNRWRHVVLGAALGITAQYAWTAVLNVLNRSISPGAAWSNVQGIEQQYMMRSLEIWWHALAVPSEFFRMLSSGVVQFLLFESPLLVSAGLVAVILLRGSWSERWFRIVAVAMPIAVGLVYLNYSTTRGYLVYGITIVLYVALAVGCSRLIVDGRRVVRIAGASMLGVIIASQLWWSSGFTWGYFVPAKMFFGFGTTDWIPAYVWQFHLPPAASLTSAEPTPVMFGGHASIAQAGAFSDVVMRSVSFSIPFGIAARALIAAYLLGLAMSFAVGIRRRVAFIVVVGALWVVPPVVAKAEALKAPPVVSTFYATHVPPGETWRYSVEISPAFLSQLDARAPAAASIEFMVPGLHPPYTVKVITGDTTLASATDGRAVLTAGIPIRTVIDAIGRWHRIDVDLTTRRKNESPVEGTSLFGWQRNGLTGRSLVDLTSGAPWKGQMLPAFEVRLHDSRGRLLLIGF